MSERRTVTMIGLGNMGTALARVIADAGHELTVWNRSSDKALPFAATGAAVAQSAAEAITRSEVIVVCLRGYDVARDLFAEAVHDASLEDKLVIQLGTGLPAEVADAAAWFAGHGAAYLDGSIMAFPEAVGDDNCQVLVSGNAETFARAEPVLNPLGGDIRFVGADPASAAILNTSALGFVYVTAHAFLSAAAMCDAAEAPLGLLREVVANLTAEMPALFGDFVHMIGTEQYDSPSLRLASAVDNLEGIAEFGRTSGIDADLFEAALRSMTASAEAGHGSNIAAVFESLKRND